MSKKNYEALCEKIRALMREKNFTYSKLSKELGKQPSYWNTILNPDLHKTEIEECLEFLKSADKQDKKYKRKNLGKNE